MFETSQQEQSSQAPKIIIGAIGVILAALAVFYFTYLSQEPAAPPAAAAAGVRRAPAHAHVPPMPLAPTRCGTCKSFDPISVATGRPRPWGCGMSRS